VPLRRRRVSAVAVAIAALVAAVAGTPLLLGDPGGRAANGPIPSADASVGERVFFQETFGGNGRTCATCHRPENEFALAPGTVQAALAANPTDPLFRAIDSDDGQGRDYTTLLQHALVNVTIPLASNVTLVDDPMRRTIVVRRSVPSIVNTFLTAPYQLDGRIPTLQQQALAAVESHFQPGRNPSPRELDAVARFESGIFEPQRMRALPDPAKGIPVPRGSTIPVTSPAALQGRIIFQNKCERCHGGETGSVAGPQTPQFSDIFVSRANALQLPLLRLAFKATDGSVTVVETPDPGRAATTGDLGDLNAFDIPSLRGIKHTAPYFHDNSAATLQDVIDHYNQFLNTNIGARDRDALIAFLETL
jgi:cytochrome c peroxidase